MPRNRPYREPLIILLTRATTETHIPRLPINLSFFILKIWDSFFSSTTSRRSIAVPGRHFPVFPMRSHLLFIGSSFFSKIIEKQVRGWISKMLEM